MSRLPQWVYHIFFWLAYFSTATLIALNVRSIHHWTYFLLLLTLLVPDLVQVYLNIYILIPRLLFRKRYFIYFPTLLISVFCQSALFIALRHYYSSHGETGFDYVKEFTVGNFFIQGLNIFSLLGLTAGIKFVKEWQEKEKQHIQTELDFLRSQIHPHFFFNTLNNLYSLTVRKSDQAPEVVLKLSGLMSYMLYESAAPVVALDREIASLENYIALEKLRFGQRLTLCFDRKGDPAGVQIPPLLLITFVENSFKHGLKHRMGPVRIDICLQIEKDMLLFEVRNPADADMEGNGQGGIGLKNVRRRLDILYGARSDLQTDNTADQFAIKLKIPL